MIVRTGEADRFIENPPRGLRAALLFGPDQGLVRERAEKLIKSVVSDLADPFRVADLDETALVGRGARLFDEAAAISMLGGRRVVRVRNAGNGLAPLFESFLEERPGDALVVVEAGDLARGKGLRRVFEDDDEAAAIACYQDTERDLLELVRSSLRSLGFSIAPDALDYAVSRLGSDRGMTRRELDKLALYAGNTKEIRLDDVRAVMDDAAESRLEEVCDAAGSGELAKLDLALERLWAEGTTPVQVLRSAMGHLRTVALLRLNHDHGDDLDPVIKRMRPPVHFSRVTSLKTQVRRWPQEKLAEALDLLLDAEALTKTTAVPAEAATGRALFNVAAMARS
jgi:DNA polymerase-3 subunit delta